MKNSYENDFLNNRTQMPNSDTKQFWYISYVVFHDESTPGNCHCFIVHLTPFTLIRKPFEFTTIVIIIFILGYERDVYAGMNKFGKIE